MKILCIFVSLAVLVVADYHEEVGIPLATKIKAIEDKLFADPSMQSRVSGGQVPNELEYPFAASLVIPLGRRISMCGASLVTPQRLVTSAHCLHGTRGSVDVRLASEYLFYGGVKITSRNFTLHPEYDLNTGNNNIGVIRLPNPVELNERIQPIEVPWGDDYAEVAGEWGWVVGWGITTDEDREKYTSYYTRWHEVSLRIVQETDCVKTYHAQALQGNIVCADGAGRVRSTCDGDAGSPLIVERNGRKILVGITTFGYKYCLTAMPSVFTRVKSYLPFTCFDSDY